YWMTGEVVFSLWRGFCVSAEQTDTAHLLLLLPEKFELHLFIHHVQRSLSRALSIMYFKKIKTNIPLAAASSTARMKSKISIILFFPLCFVVVRMESH
ncbi:hypothetical protein, partial [Turicimonas muris]|uniref:hypothetical protein n=1 Tax=Turicimonas muris TaxID=1796652 RepID=UPI003F67C1BF